MVKGTTGDARGQRQAQRRLHENTPNKGWVAAWREHRAMSRCRGAMACWPRQPVRQIGRTASPCCAADLRTFGCKGLQEISRISRKQNTPPHKPWRTPSHLTGDFAARRRFAGSTSAKRMKRCRRGRRVRARSHAEPSRCTRWGQCRAGAHATAWRSAHQAAASKRGCSRGHVAWLYGSRGA